MSTQNSRSAVPSQTGHSPSWSGWDEIRSMETELMPSSHHSPPRGRNSTFCGASALGPLPMSGFSHRAVSSSMTWQPSDLLRSRNGDDTGDVYASGLAEASIRSVSSRQIANFWKPICPPWRPRMIRSGPSGTYQTESPKRSHSDSAAPAVRSAMGNAWIVPTIERWNLANRSVNTVREAKAG